jgi:methionine-R-sulfoxide reductase
MRTLSQKACLISLSAMLLLMYCSSNAQQGNPKSTTTKKDTMSTELPKTEGDWKKKLSDEQYYVLREKGTERPFTGKFYLHKDKGVYTCAACGNELFTSDMKFDSHCGWPSFDREIKGGKIKTEVDSSHGMIRTEIMCAKCGGHLGHLFNDGPTETWYSLLREFVIVGICSGKKVSDWR